MTDTELVVIAIGVAAGISLDAALKARREGDPSRVQHASQRVIDLLDLERRIKTGQLVLSGKILPLAEEKTTDLAADHGLVPESEVMRLRGVTKRTLCNERSQGGGPPFVKLGKTIYYPIKGLQEYIAKSAVTPTLERSLIDGQKSRRRHGREKHDGDGT